MDDPCERCIVKSCCQIRKREMWYKCGCNNYELYRFWLCYSYNETSHIANLMMKDNPRVKEILKNKI